MELKILKCKVCNKVALIMSRKTPQDTICCNEVMDELVPNTTDGAKEKHVPVVNNNNGVVEVVIGSDVHPMEENHYIEWILIETNLGYQIKHLNPRELPKAIFKLNNNEQLQFAYAYCNVHGLWRK